MLGSVSRVAPAVAEAEDLEAAYEIRRLLAAWRDAKDLIEIDAYARGSNPVVDRAIAMKPAIDKFCRQRISDLSTLEETRQRLGRLFSPQSPALPEVQQ